MKIGNIKISDEWSAMKISDIVISDEWSILDSSLRWLHTSKTCTGHDDEGRFTTFIGLSYNQQKNKWMLELSGFPEQEYNSFYPNNSKLEFDSAREGKDHIDNFLFKLNNLIAFL